MELVPHVVKRPMELEADVVRFQNNKEKWIAFVGLMNGRPYEIFTGLADDDDGIFCPKSVTKGKIIKAIDDKGNKRYDFQFINKRGYKTTIEGLSDKFNPEYWNYAKLISGVLRYGMPIDQVIKLVGGLELNSQSINTWKMGVERALKKYLPNGGGSIFTFEIKGGEKEAHKFIDNLEIFSLLANVADSKSLVIHPATTTHSQCSDAELAEQGIKPNTIRLSIGTENIDDLIAALDDAFDAIG